MIDKKWHNIISILDFAFQPIVNIKSGRVFGVEALLRNYKEAGGFNSIYTLFDEAYHDGVLYQLDLELRVKAIQKFKTIKVENAKLFYNIDNRLIYMPDFTLGNTNDLLEKLHLPKSAFCLEITEKATIHDASSVQNLINRYKKEGFDIAVDNFGTGIAGLQILYYAQNDFIKLDRFFINDIHTDAKKRLFCSNIINIAHLMGLKVIATGLEEEEEYLTCKDIGVDFVQGFLIQKPKTDTGKIRPKYTAISDLYKNDQRSHTSNIIDKSKIDYIEPLSINTSLHDLFIYFQSNPENIFVPIVDDLNQLQGVIYEKDIKKLSYSQYGISLAKNDQSNSNSKIKQFIKTTISSEITWGVDKVLQAYNTDRDSSFGIFITKNGKYYGFIDVNNLLSISYNRNLEIAKDQNPLTKLPGNRQIDIFISEALSNKDHYVHHIVYFDFNDFKPFNDAYGFRQGDRAIMIFADILKTNLPSDTFIAHIGGDDFFMGFRNKAFDEVYTLTDMIQEKFKNEVLNLYNDKDKANGYIETADRFGIKRQFKLLGVCSAIIEIAVEKKASDLDLVLGKLKKEAKKSSTPLGSSICNIDLM